MALQSSKAASDKREIQRIHTSTSELLTELYSLRKMCKDNWEGRASESFKSKIDQLIKTTEDAVHFLKGAEKKYGDLVSKYLNEEQELESLTETDLGGGGGGF